jgi:apolipoprotein N-acyltransferase
VTAARRELLLAAASGLAMGAAFLPLPSGALAWGAFVPLLVALETRVGRGPGACFRLGYVAGFVFFLAGMHWIALLSDVASTVPWIKYVAWVMSGFYLALFWGLATWLAGVLARRSGLAARWTFVPAMLLVEELRGSGELGFPWFQPGYTQHALPAIGLAALGSVTLVTAWVLLVNAALGHAFVKRTRGAVALALALLALPWANRAWFAPAGGGRPAAFVALVQGNIPGEIKWEGHHQAEILSAFLALSDTAMARRDALGRAPSLVIWPETATGSYLRRQLDQSFEVARWASSRHVPVFCGFADYAYGPDGRPVAWNAAGMWRADGSLSDTYAKRHLVPFGERVPFQWLVPALGRIDFGQAEWQPGTKTVLFPSEAGPFSCLVCFESIFPDLARRDVRAGARMLVNVTNDEWFGNSAALYQHAAMSPFRAVENGVPVLRCANTGLTDVIAPNGRVLARAPVFRPAVLAAGVPPATGPTPYDTLGDWPGALAALGALALAFAPWRRARGSS